MNKKISLVDIFFIMIAIIFIMILGSINLFHYNNGLNSDIAAEGLLAREIWENKEWIPSSWYASTEARLISVTAWSALFYGLTGSMVLAMGIGAFLGAVLLWVSGAYLTKGLELGRTERLLFLILCMILPYGAVQMELLYARTGYYVVHGIVLFLTLGYYVRLLYDKKDNYFMLGMLVVMHFLLGGQGIRGILMVTGPLMVVEVIRRIYTFWVDKHFTWKENKISLFMIGMLVIEYLGTKLPYTVGIPVSRNIRKAPEKFIYEVMPRFLSEIGFGKDNIMRSICAVFGMVSICIVIGKIVLEVLKKKKLKPTDWAVFSLFLSPMLTVCALTFTTTATAGRYFVIIYFCIALSITILWGNFDKIIKGLIIGFVVFTCALNLK